LSDYEPRRLLQFARLSDRDVIGTVIGEKLAGIAQAQVGSSVGVLREFDIFWTADEE